MCPLTLVLRGCRELPLIADVAVSLVSRSESVVRRNPPTEEC